MSGNTRDLIQRYIYVFGMWEPSISDWLYDFLKPNDVVIDVGANVGYITLLAASRVGPGGRVYSFEPVPSIAQQLRRNVELNEYVNITIVPKVVADGSGTAEIFRHDDTNSGMSSTREAHGLISEGAVGKIRLADVIDPELWPSVSLLKIDTEGDEMRVLRGATPILEAMPPSGAVLVEITPHLLAARGDSGADIVGVLTELGFCGYVISNSYDPRSYVFPDAAGPRPFDGSVDGPVDTVFIKG